MVTALALLLHKSKKRDRIYLMNIFEETDDDDFGRFVEFLNSQFKVA